MKKSMIQLASAVLALSAFFVLSGCRQLFSEIAAVSKAITVTWVGDFEGSTAVVNNPDAEAGETVTLTITPYKYVKTFVTSISGATLSGTNADKIRTFTMPDGNVNITVTFTQYEEGNIVPEGTIFYAKPSESDGWKYLVAANSTRPDKIFESYSSSMPHYTALLYSNFSFILGKGYENTDKLKALNGDGAAKYCWNLSYIAGGVTYDDWFLPNMAEIKKLDEVVSHTDTNVWYWTSNPYSSTDVGSYYISDACIYKMNNSGSGAEDAQTKNLPYKVWPVRRF
jgi:hypothetical protein